MIMQLESALTFGFDLNDRLGGRAWMEILTTALARRAEGLAVCDAESSVLFADARAVHLLGRLGMGLDRALPDSVVRLVRGHMATGGEQRSVVLDAMVIELAVLRGLAGGAHVAIFLREEQP